MSRWNTYDLKPALASAERYTQKLGKIADLEHENYRKLQDRTAIADASNRAMAPGGGPAANARVGLSSGQPAGLSSPVLAPAANIPKLGDPKSGSFRTESDGFQTIQQNTFDPGKGMQAFNDLRGRGSDVATWKDKSGRERVMTFTNTPKYQQEAGLPYSEARAIRGTLDQQSADYEQAMRGARAQQGLELAKSQSKVLGGLYESLDKYSGMAAGFSLNPITGQIEKIEDPKVIEYARGMVDSIRKEIDTINSGLYQKNDSRQAANGSASQDSFGDLVRQAGEGGNSAGKSPGAPQLMPSHEQNLKAKERDADLKDIASRANSTLAAARTQPASHWPGDQLPSGNYPGPNLERTAQWMRDNVLPSRAQDMNYWDPTAPVSAPPARPQAVPGPGRVTPYGDAALPHGPSAKIPAIFPAPFSDRRMLAGESIRPDKPFKPGATPEELSKWIRQRITAERPGQQAQSTGKEIRRPVTAVRPGQDKGQSGKEIRRPVKAKRPSAKEIRRRITDTRRTSQDENDDGWIRRPVTAVRPLTRRKPAIDWSR